MPEQILITGVSGYIGFQTLVLAHEAGHFVRATIRNSAQAEKLSSHIRIQPYINKQVTFVTIPDLAAVDVLVANLTDVSGILHLASPLAIETENYERDIIQPALSITNSVLTAATKVPTIKKVVITSSAVTLVPFSWLSKPESESLYTSSMINTDTSGPYHSGMEAYWSSKAISRARVHEFIKDQAPTFDIIQLLPSVVIGPDLLAQNTADVLTGTRAMALGPVLGINSPYPLVGAPVHVLDVAKAHVDALKPSIPGNVDYILSSDTPDGMRWNDFLETAKKHFPEAIRTGLLKMGGDLPTTKWKIGTEEMEKVFGWRCTGFEETAKQLVASYVEFAKKEGKKV